MNLHDVLNPEILVFLIPIVAILVGGTIAITKVLIRHRERLAMIEHGIHPDYPPDREPGSALESSDTTPRSRAED